MNKISRKQLDMLLGAYHIIDTLTDELNAEGNDVDSLYRAWMLLNEEIQEQTGYEDVIKTVYEYLDRKGLR
jgi:hypothetical protein